MTTADSPVPGTPTDHALSRTRLVHIRHDAEIMQRRAIARPIDVGEMPTIQEQWGYGGGARAVLGSMSVESCGCLSETPIWHVSVSAWSLITRRKLDDEATTRAACEAMLHGVGSVDSLWWWNPDVRVGHLRSHLTGAEAHAVPAHIPGPEDHQEDGEWYRRAVDA